MALSYDLYFTGSSGDPRQCIVMGEDVEPVFFRFETPAVPMTLTRTTVFRNQELVPVATLTWANARFFETITVGQRPSFPMAALVMNGSTPFSRAFVLQSTVFEWRRSFDSTSLAFSYELYTQQNLRLAEFRRCNLATPVGPSHGVMRYNYMPPVLLLEALLALCLNRWIDIYL